MAFKLPENVQETSTTTGTGTLDLLGAVSGAFAFGSQLSNGDTTLYVMSDGTDMEAGIGTYTNAAGQKLSRDTVIYSTNGGALVNWAAGTRDVMVALPGGAIASLIDPVSGTGIMVQTGDRAYTRRSLVAGNGVAIDNPSGVAGAPTIRQNIITTRGDLIVGDVAANTAIRLPRGTVGQVLTAQNNDIAWLSPIHHMTGGSEQTLAQGGAIRYASWAHGNVGQVAESSCMAYRMAVQCTLFNFRFRAANNTIGAATTITIRVNNVSTALSVSTSGTGAAVNSSDTVSVSAGDLVTLQFSSAGSSGAMTGGAWSCQMRYP